MCVVPLLAFQYFIVEHLNRLALILNLRWTVSFQICLLVIDIAYIYLKEANDNSLNLHFQS